MRVAAATDVGRERQRNEDAHLVDLRRGLLVVADGMGGHPAGDLASSLAVERTDRDLKGTVNGETDTGRIRTLGAAVRAAHVEVRSAATEDPTKRGMGTTLVVAHIDESERLLTLANVGDSRAYLLRDGEARQLTTDDVWSGVFGRTLTQAIGASAVVEPEVIEVEMQPGDRLLLCTDGLTDELSTEAISELMATPDLDDAGQALVDAALEAGGHDNVTVVLAEIEN